MVGKKTSQLIHQHLESHSANYSKIFDSKVLLAQGSNQITSFSILDTQNDFLDKTIHRELMYPDYKVQYYQKVSEVGQGKLESNHFTANR